VQLITEETVEVIGNLLDDSNNRYSALMFLDTLASSRPMDVLPYEEKLLSVMSSDINASSLVSGLLVKLVTDHPVRMSDKYNDKMR